MPIRFASTCAAYYVNLRLNLKMDLPTKRETVLGLFDRLRRQRPGLAQFRRYQNELALESDAADDENSSAWQEWVAVRRTSVRAGSVCPREWDDAYALHTAVIESAPYFLDISALDIESVEVLLGFDLAAPGNHDAIVCNALMAGTPMAMLATGGNASQPGRGAGGSRPMTFRPVDCQPIFGVALNDANDLQAHIEVKTRSSRRGAGSIGGNDESPSRGRDEPISLYLIVRRFGPFSDVAALPAQLRELRTAAHELLDAYVEPKVLSPIRDEIVAGGWM
jgi:hypothetical protein